MTIADTTPRQALIRFQRTLGLSDGEIATAVGVSTRTLHRWRGAEAYPQHGARNALTGLLELADELEQTFESPEAAKSWLRADSRYLGGLTPAEAIKVGRIDRARAALEALGSGIHL